MVQKGLNHKIELILIVFLIYGQFLNAQPKIKFFKTAHDFGRVANLDYAPVAFEFKNIGNKPLAILLINKNPQIKVSYKSKFIPPDSISRIYVLPDLNRMGNFYEELSIITNASDEPEIIAVTGDVVSVQECFPNQNNMNIREVNVIDKITKKPISLASLLFIHNMNEQITGSTNRDGKWFEELLVGQYNTTISANNYQTLEKSFYLPRSVPILFFELEPDVNNTNLPGIEIAVEDTGTKVDDEPLTDVSLLPVEKYAANNIVLLVDVSLSMKSENKLELLKVSVINLVNALRSIDNVALISYAENPEIILSSVTGDDKRRINDKVKKLEPAGITNGVKGLESAYNMASKKFISKGNNQIILATDGRFTEGAGGLSPEECQLLIADYSIKGIKLSIIGFGVDEKAMKFMKEMAFYGKGRYIHVNTKEDISTILLDEIKSNSLINDR